VEAFLQEKISFPAIPEVVEDTALRHAILHCRASMSWLDIDRRSRSPASDAGAPARRPARDGNPILTRGGFSRTWAF